jgi:hypothetical protein
LRRWSMGTLGPFEMDPRRRVEAMLEARDGVDTAGCIIDDPNDGSSGLHAALTEVSELADFATLH